MERFYLECEEPDYYIMERHGAGPQGEEYDSTCFCVSTQSDAANAVDILNKLYEKAKDK
jgi:hypothetical protein